MCSFRIYLDFSAFLLSSTLTSQEAQEASPQRDAAPVFYLHQTLSSLMAS